MIPKPACVLPALDLSMEYEISNIQLWKRYLVTYGDMVCQSQSFTTDQDCIVQHRSSARCTAEYLESDCFPVQLRPA